MIRGNHEAFNNHSSSRHFNRVFGSNRDKGYKVLIGLYRVCTVCRTKVVGRKHIVSRTKRRILVLAIVSFIAMC